MSKVTLITGVGPGTGTALVRRFVEGGYDVAMLARNGDRLQALSAELAAAHAYECDVADDTALAESYEKITSELGAPQIIIHNAVSAERGNYMDINPDGLIKAFEVMDITK